MARVLVKKKMAKAIRDATSTGDPSESDDLAPGHMRLYGYYKPSLEAGLYGIEAVQTITAPNNVPLYIWNYQGPKVPPPPPPPAPPPIMPPATIEKQTFTVEAPQFNIDSKLINTYYPPSGHQDEGRILPHIVFSDPHVPWLRLPGVAFKGPVDPDPSDPTSGGRNMTPWMALLVFDPAELVVQSIDAIGIGLASISSIGITSSGTPVPAYIPTKLPGNGAYAMTVGDYLTKVTKNRVYYEAGYTEPEAKADWTQLQKSTDQTSIIFPTKSRLKEIFGTDLGVISGHKFLSHVRNVNTIGFPGAGVEEDGFFSVIVSSMTGRVDNSVPVTQVVHLVSIEHLDSTLTDPKSPFSALSGTERIGLVSLYSWVYTSIPEAVNFVQLMKNLAASMQPLKPVQSVLDSLKTSVQTTPGMKSAAQILHDRLDNSYTLCRWRTSTGDETAAFNRGPLVAAPTPDVPSKTPSTWPSLSMAGKDYQVFDDDVGMMDVTYSSAWSLGRLVAISDSPFNAALLRFRSLVWQRSSSNTRLVVNNVQSATRVLSQVSSSIRNAHSLQPSKFSGTVARLAPSSTDAVAPPLSHPDIAPVFAEAVQQTVHNLASADSGEQIYNDFNLASATNSDWELIHNWISDCLYLSKIPAHYLFPEPAHIQGAPNAAAPISLPNVPPEALRFFSIDNAWLDCFIDGALSCCNHLEPQYDSTRQHIKEVYNYYLRSTIHPLEGQTPPIPRSGFILRSSAVKAIPDLKVTVTARTGDATNSKWIETPSRDPLVQLTKMDDFTILCLLDCLPQEVIQVVIAQPPHQQRFAMGASLKPDPSGNIAPELEIKMLYTTNGPTGIWPLASVQPDAGDQLLYYSPKTRVIVPTEIANSVNKALLASNAASVKQGSPVLYGDQVPDSCLVGLELNDPSYQLVLTEPIPSTGPTQWTRQLWTGSAAADFQPKAMLSNKMMISASGSQSNKKKAQILLPLAITAAETQQMPPAPGAARFNFSRIVPVSVSKSTTPKAAKPSTTPSGPLAPAVAQFMVVVHPDYRPAPPTPFQQASGNTYAPKDFLPTETNNLFDLIIAIRRIDPTNNSGYQLTQLAIEFPVSDGKDLPDGNGNIREPLIPAGGYKGEGVRMTSNQRFVPTLYHSPDSNFPGKTILGVKLIPRSSDPVAVGSVTSTSSVASIALRNDGRTADASVRLSDCLLAPVVDKTQKVSVANGTGSPAAEPRGICKIVLKETYITTVDNKLFLDTIVTDGNIVQPGVPLWVLKKSGGDVDLNGNPV